MRDRWLIPEVKAEDLSPLRENLVPTFARSMYSQHQKVEEAMQDPALGPAREDLMAFIKMTFSTYVDEEFHRDVCRHIQKVIIPRKDGTREIDRLMLFAPPQSGKLIAHDTPVLTLDGWKSHGELRVGGLVFGRSGEPVKVLALSGDGVADREVEFTDGSRIICHARHEWLVRDRARESSNRYKPKVGRSRRYRPVENVWETEEIEKAGPWFGPHRRGGRARFQVDANVGVDFPSRCLPVPPYVLGAWLGDGSATKNCITHSPDDMAVVDRIEALGIGATGASTHRVTGVVTTYFRGLYKPLKASGLFGHKHIPPDYLAASRQQRLELLAGLMDTDGNLCLGNGRATFANTNREVVEGTVRLISSLGWRTTIVESAPVLSSSGIQGRKAVFQVSFSPDEPLPVSLGRKRDIFRRPVRRKRGIVAVRKCEPRPGRCIQVEGGVYLVGPTLIPTHNSEIVSTRLPGYWLAKNPELPVALISYGGHLAFRNSRNARAVVDHPTFMALFPECLMDPGNWRQQDWHVWGHKGYCIAAGVNGPLTGHGFGLAVIDDPTESWAKAQSDVERENLWSWYNGTFLPRMWEHGAIILMQTRWHDDDLPGRILAREGRVEEGGRWTVKSYKALADENDGLGRRPGEALCPSRFSKEFLEVQRDTMSAQAWWAEYQQTPIQPEGNWFKVGRVQIVDSVPAEVAEVQARVDGDPVIVSVRRAMRFWDLAGTEKKEQKQDPDYTVGSLLVVHKGSTYVLDVRRGRYGPEDVWDLLATTARVDGKKTRVRIEQEPGQSGKAQIAAFVKMLQGYDVQGVPASGDKIIRTDPFAAQLNAGNVYLLKASWNREWVTELSNFPFGKHDDQIMSVATGYSTEVTEQKFRAATFAHL